MRIPCYLSIIWYYGPLNRPTLAYFYHRTKYNFSISALKPVQLSLVGPEDAPRLHQKRNQSPRGAKQGCNMRGWGCPNFVPMQILILSRDKKFEKCPVFSLSPSQFVILTAGFIMRILWLFFLNMLVLTYLKAIWMIIKKSLEPFLKKSIFSIFG